MKRVIEILNNEFGLKGDILKVSNIGHIETLEFDIASNRKIIVLVDDLESLFRFDVYDPCGGGYHHKTDAREWIKLNSCVKDTITELIDCIEIYLYG